MKRMDSIRENLTKTDIIDMVLFELNADIEHKLHIVFVEGTDDILFGKKVFEEYVAVLESFSGKEGLKELLECAELSSEPRIIAVRDKDYADESALSDRMFVYDGSCMEMMLLKNYDVLKGFCDIYCMTEGSCTELLTNVMHELAAYSVARKRNEQEGLGLRFRAGFGDMIKRGEFCLDELFQREGFSDELKEACKREAAALSVAELYEITNGHDICKYLAAISVNGKGNTMGEADVRKTLLCAYRKEDFKETRLYRKIKQYQIQYQLQFLT
ncbi:MAG: hypothetical protein K2P45_03445 [Eubacterium sp.]|nr:hypothetical protein [Eubacterium sp.]